MIEQFIQLPNGYRQNAKASDADCVSTLLPKRAAEDVYQLWVWDFGKKLFAPTDDNCKYGKSGNVPITDSWNLKPIKYRVLLGDKPCVRLNFDHRQARQEQVVYLDTLPIKFGLKPYFLCPLCNKRIAKVYLRHDRWMFTCFTCSNLYYRNSRLNPKTSLGSLMRRLYNIGRLEIKEKHLNCRYSYAGKLTKRCVNWLKFYAKLACPEFISQKA